MELMLSDAYLHPSGQLPAYEWNFGDVNPPVHAWATLFAFHNEHEPARPRSDLDFLRAAFHKLLLNFTWWVNRKDPAGHNVFEGGFLGLDNIGVFDRTPRCPPAAVSNRPTARRGWALQPEHAEIALELAHARLGLRGHRPQVHRALLPRSPAPTDQVGQTDDELWDEEDGFFYDVLRLPDGTAERLKVRSMVGLLPLCAVDRHSPRGLERFQKPAGGALATRSNVTAGSCSTARRPADGPAVDGRRLLSRVNEDKLRRDPDAHARRGAVPLPARAPRALAVASRPPLRLRPRRADLPVAYEPAESDTGMFGGNSNWRGPVWFPVNMLIIRGLLQFYLYYGDDFTIECPTGSGNQMTLFEIANELSDRLVLDLPARRRRPPPGLRRDGPLPERPALARPDPLLRVLPRRQRRRARRHAPDRLDRCGRQADPAVRIDGRGDRPPGRDAAGHRAVPPDRHAGRISPVAGADRIRAATVRQPPAAAPSTRGGS